MQSSKKHRQTLMWQGSRPALAYTFLLGGFVSALVISQVLAAKTAALELPIIGTVIFPAGAIAYALTFLATDVISECYGRVAANRAVIAGLVANILVVAVNRIACILPSAPLFENAEYFQTMVSPTLRVTLASMAAYLVSQFHNVWLFHYLREISRGKRLWLRNNIATMVSQTFDTIIFLTIASSGDMPMLGLMFGYLLVKWILALADTPLVYLLTYLIIEYSLPARERAKSKPKELP